MEKEQIVSRLIDEINIPSDKFGLAYHIIEHCVDSMLRDFQNENKSLVKTLEKYNEEMIELRKENEDLKNSNNELLEGLISTQKRLEEWLEKCK